LDTSVGRANFVRRLYNLRHELEKDEETEDAEAQIQRLQEAIMRHDKKHPIKSFYTKDNNNNKRKRPNNDVDNRGAGGGAGGVSATDVAELGAHGYEVKPQAGDIVDEKGGVIKAPSRSKVRQPLSSYALR